MPNNSTDGRAFLSRLDQYWVKAGSRVRPISSERLIRVCGEHWIKYVFPSFLYFILSGTALFFAYVSLFTDRYLAEVSVIIFLTCFAFFFCVHHWFFWFLLAETQTHIYITSKRVLFMKSGLLWGEETIEIAYEKMKTVEAHKKTFLQSILNYGTLQFEPFKIMRVPHPGTLARLIQQSMGMT